MLPAVVLMLEIVDCKLERVANDGVVVLSVTLRPAELACIAGELDRAADMWITEGEVRLRLDMDGECFVTGELTLAVDGEFLKLDVADGEFRIPVALVTDGDFLIA